MPQIRTLFRLLSAGCLTATLAATAVAQTDPPAAATQQPVSPVNLAHEVESADGSLIEKASLLIGFNFVENIKQQDVELDLDKTMEGMQLAAAGSELPMDDEEIRSVMQAFQEFAMQKARAKQALLMQQNLAKGQAFLEENGKRQGVQTLENGVQYEVLASGAADAKSPTATDWVKVNYKGTLTNNEQFDASEEGEPAEFAVSGVIRGLSAALMEMKVGDKWKIFIPSELGYGKRGSRSRIGPNETLIFEVEMLDVFDNKDQ